MTVCYSTSGDNYASTAELI